MSESTALRETSSERQRSTDSALVLSTQDIDNFAAKFRNSGDKQTATNHGQNVLPDLQLTDEGNFSKCGKPANDTFTKCVDLKEEPEAKKEKGHDNLDPRKLDTPSEMAHKVDKALTSDSLSTMRNTLEDVASQAQKHLDLSGGSPLELRKFEDQLNRQVKAEGKGVAFDVKDGKVTAHLLEEVHGKAAAMFLAGATHPEGMYKYGGTTAVRDIIPPVKAKEQHYSRAFH